MPFTRATALALKLSLVTAQRIGEVTGIALSELDLNPAAPAWTVPGIRSKNGQANRVPLSRLALKLIEEARGLGGDSPWLFPSPKWSGPIDARPDESGPSRARCPWHQRLSRSRSEADRGDPRGRDGDKPAHDLSCA